MDFLKISHNHSILTCFLTQEQSRLTLTRANSKFRRNYLFPGHSLEKYVLIRPQVVLHLGDKTR